MGHPFKVNLAQKLRAETTVTVEWIAERLQGRRKSDPQKVRMAARLRRETTMTLEWVAARLCMGAPTHVAALLQRHNQKVQYSEETLF